MQKDRPRRVDALRERSPGLHRLLTSHEAPYPLLRDLAIGGLAILLVLSALWTYTGRWGHSPVVVVESGSMMHCTNGYHPLGRDCDAERYGRVGTIDPGDLILVKQAPGRGSVQTLAGGGEHHYGRAGDVIVYKPDGLEGRTPVIHRALFWLEVNADGTFSIPELGFDRVEDLDDPQIQALGLPSGYAAVVSDPQFDALCGPAGPQRSGFITRGDNNPAADQSRDVHGAVAVCPVQPQWVVGQARGEIPWLGLVKLLVTDVMSWVVGPQRTDNYHNAAFDSKVLLWVSVALLVGGPYAYEKVKHRRAQRAEGQAEGQQSPPPAEPPAKPPGGT